METMSDWFFLIMGLSGGLAIFLLGTDRTVSGLKGLAGNRLRWILGHLTGNRWYGAATGAEITAIIQSSSVTTVVVVGLVSAQAMTLLMSVGVIFGANVGTTITAQIIAFKVTRPCRGRYRFRDRLLRKVRACGADWAHRHGSRARVFLECR